MLEKTIAVIGAGAMGNGIAHLFTASGFRVNLTARSEKSLAGTLATISTNLDRQIKKGTITESVKKAALSNISVHTSLKSAVTDTAIVIETVPENIELKLDIFKQLDQLCSPETILASNTSSFSITKLASVTNRADKVIGMHFMNPVPVMPLVEIIRGYSTSDAVTSTIATLAKQVGKVPVEVNDYPGFVASRLLAVLINEAAYSLYEDVAGVEEIDTVMKLGMGHKLGPLQVGDFVGLDVVLNVMQLLYVEFKNPKYAPCPLLVNMVAAGHLGVKSGKGFYEYTTGSKEIKVALRFNKR